MADVTINNLPDLAVTGTNYLVHTNGTTTGRATVTQLKAALSLANVASTGNYNDLSNRPTIPTQTNQLTNNSGYITSSSLGVAKAWVNMDGLNNTIRSSYNIASVSRQGTGIYRVNLSVGPGNSNYTVTATSGTGGGAFIVYIDAITSTYAQFITRGTSSNANVNILCASFYW